ncbi:MAG: hemolysin family protein [Anaerolineales bacterium]
MDNPYLEILVIFLLLILNGVFAMSEMALVASRKTRLQQQAEDGVPGARAAFKLANNPTDFLSMVQVGITLVGILAGAFGGATIAEKLEAFFLTIPVLNEYAEAVSVFVVVVTITYFSLVIGELVPKRIALNNPEQIAVSIAAPLRIMTPVFAPFVRLLSFSTNLALRVLGIRPSTDPPITEDEIKVLIAQGTESGIFEESEQDMIEGVMRLSERKVGELMTPRSQVNWLSLSDTPEIIWQKVLESDYSRLPLVETNLDDVIGIVYTKDVLLKSIRGEVPDLRALAHSPLFVVENLPALKVLELFKKRKAFLAFVVNEYGGIEGIVTHNDILEDIVGYVPQFGVIEEEEIVRRDDGSYLVDGLCLIDKAKEVLEIEDDLPGEETGYYHTVGGFVFSHLGKVPATGEKFVWGGYTFEVMDMDGRRVDKVLIQKNSA